MLNITFYVLVTLVSFCGNFMLKFDDKFWHKIFYALRRYWKDFVLMRYERILQGLQARVLFQTLANASSSSVYEFCEYALNLSSFGANRFENRLSIDSSLEIFKSIARFFY